jgi:5'-nucleotidase
MPLDLSRTLVVGISSRALFDLEEENKIYEEEGLKPYSRNQIEHTRRHLANNQVC